MLKKFCQTFDYEIPDNIITLDKKYFLINKKIKKIIDINKPKSAGIFLGTEKNKKFKPSIALLDIIFNKTDKKIIVDDKSAFLFVCGRDIMKTSILESSIDKRLCLVSDRFNNNLGLAKLNLKENIAATNILDIGNFLRREKR